MTTPSKAAMALAEKIWDGWVSDDYVPDSEKPEHKAGLAALIDQHVAGLAGSMFAINERLTGQTSDNDDDIVVRGHHMATNRLLIREADAALKDWRPQ